ncbi:SAM-dependent methyltransferase [Dactylosporangium sp. CA-092794]|uniref:SAM-dependent methyltransferase n=1 Tax=Dactylosporangium sp. CA-092794 TaxID=3239929 RepID=UPI003D8AFBB4
MERGSARWTAAVRARESARPDRLFEDPWAEVLAGGADAGPDNPFLVVRTRYFDDAVTAAGWLRQLVLLGAGLDTRAWRLPLPAGATVFEVDLPVLLAAKHERIPARPGCAVRIVEADLRGDWGPALLGAGFDPGAPTLWLAEGLLFHLPAAAVGPLLAGAAALTGGGRFLADVFGTGLLRLPSLQPMIESRRRYHLSPPFCTDDPAGLFRDAGWADVTWDLAGSPAANHGRLTGRAEPDDPGMRTYLVAAAV